MIQRRHIRYTELTYEFDGGKDDYLNATSDNEDTAEAVTYVAFKQHFYTSVLLTNTPFKIEWFIYAQTIAYGITCLLGFLLVLRQTKEFSFNS